MPAPDICAAPPTPRPAAKPGEHPWFCWECPGPDRRWRVTRGDGWEAAFYRHLTREHGARR